MKNRLLIFIAFTIAILLLLPDNIKSFSFTFTNNGVDIVTHPIGYDGTGEVITVTVGIDPASANSADMVIPTQNVVTTINALMETTGNLQTANVPFTEYDFESVLLHEMVHSLGLGHTNVGGSGASNEYTNSDEGTNGVYDLDDGTDNIIGSADDIRGDDVNLNWFRTSNNNPFTIAGTVDATTYSRDLTDLPGGDTYSANASVDVAVGLGIADTEAVMQQGTPNGQAQRTLGHDDVAGLRYGMSGIDETAGSGDDYTLVLNYIGLDAGADIVIAFDNGQTGFAVSSSSGTFLTPTHVAITGNNIYFNTTAVTWFFNDIQLPIELVNFTVRKKGRSALLQWATATEINNDYFTIERSSDGLNFEKIESISGAGSSVEKTDYQTYDHQPDNGINYYRLKQTDFDGTSTSSRVVSLRFDDNNEMKVLPNPAKDNDITLSYSATKNGEVFVEIIDMSGRIMSNQVYPASRGDNQFNIDISNYKNGVYILRTHQEATVETIRFVKL